MSTNNKQLNLYSETKMPGHTPDDQQPILEQNPEKKSVWNMIFNIIGHGMVGSSIIIISLLIIVSEIVMIGHIKNSTIYLQAKENTNIISRVLITTSFNFNMGMLICISRCLSLNDYKGVDHFKKMNF